MKKDASEKLVFVVDDDVPSYQLIEALFSDYKVKLRHFLNGHDMMKAFKNELPDLIIMDIQLPDIDGLDLTRKIKAIRPYLTVIAYTAYAMHGDRERCIKSGCAEYMSKPIDLDGFYQLVTKYLGD